jgi:hypothetical protein
MWLYFEKQRGGATYILAKNMSYITNQASTMLALCD